MRASPTEVVAELQGAGEPHPVSTLGDIGILVKARLSLMVVFTTAVGFCVGSDGCFPSLGLLCAIVGTALAAGSAAALNQVLEAEVDRLMERTRLRPLPSGRMRKGTALAIGLMLGVCGVGILAAFNSVLSGLLGLSTVLIYLLLYTPLKRRSAWCTIVGAVAGALPPVIGWAASGAHVFMWAIVLFGTLFFWQIPHFLAIAWMYKAEYQGAGFVMLKCDDVDGKVTAAQACGFSFGLFVVTLIPVLYSKVSFAYFIGVSGFNCLMLAMSVLFFIERSRVAAKRLFFTSLLYLPGVLLLLVFARKL